MGDSKSTVEILQDVTTELFLIKEKITDEEYMNLLQKCKNVFDKIDNDNKVKLKMYTELNRLKNRYIKLSTCFIQMHYSCHGIEEQEEEESLVSFIHAST